MQKKAEAENRLINAAVYYRSAEFYIYDLKEKEEIYDKFSDIFYAATKNEHYEKIMVPYKNGRIPTIKLNAVGQKKGTILLHGGFDSFLEEWFYIMKYLSGNGFDVIGFEGPGQGHMLIKQGVPFDYQWEKPVKHILDFFKTEQVAIFGLSMGGWLAIRAAAFEPRINNVIVSGHAVDYSRIPPDFSRSMMMFFIKYFREYTANMFVKTSLKENLERMADFPIIPYNRITAIRGL